jgi:predicted HTH transcriptional regulator
MTIQKLAEPHASIPANPLLCESLFLARYIEKAGTGTLDMIRLCRENKIPEPVFRQDGGQFVVTLRRERNFREELIQLGLSERQIQFFAYLKREREAQMQIIRLSPELPKVLLPVISMSWYSLVS